MKVEIDKKADYLFYDLPFPELNLDNNYQLIEQSVQDSTSFLNYYNDPAVYKYILATVPNTTELAINEVSYCRNLFYTRKGIYWSIVKKNDQRMIGAIGLYINQESNTAEISYDLGKNYWGQGITCQAMRQVINFCFTQIKLSTIEAITLEENTASLKLLKKIGFHHTGTLACYKFFQGRYHDVERYVLTAKDN